jgi:hypothetical protein
MSSLTDKFIKIISGKESLNPTFVRSPTKVADPKVGEVYVKTES